MSSKGLRTAVVVLVLLALAVVGWQLTRPSQRTVTAYFSSASAVYAGNPVELLGVPVGSVESVTPEAGRVKVVLKLDDDVTLPRSVHALQVSPSLISGRSIALAPAYSHGPRLEDGAVIPVARTEVPLDVNDLYRSAKDLAGALGPKGANREGSLTRALDVMAANLRGNGDAFARAIDGLAGATGTLSGSRKDLTGTIGSLQTFVSTLADNDDGVRTLNTRLANVSGFLAEDRDELGGALAQLSRTLGEVATFVQDNRQLLHSNVDKLTKVTRILVRQRKVLAGILDEAPAGLGNLLNAYDAAGGTLDVRMDVNELMDSPVALICELVNRGAPGGLPAALTQLCSTASSASSSLPSPADLLALLQGKDFGQSGGAR